MKRILFIFISIPLLLFGAASLVYAQETSDYSKLTTEDYTNISLPPLDLLFENAKGGPVYELATIEEQIERKLLTKGKKAVLGFINVRGSYQWGKFGSDYTFTDVSTPILYNYSTSKQKTYTVGAAVNIPLDDLFDLAPRVRRQKLNVTKATLEREVKFEELKREIIELYATATSQLNVLKLRAESLVLANVQYNIAEKDFTNNAIESGTLSLEKERQSDALEAFEKSKFELTKSLMILELITRTPILKK